MRLPLVLSLIAQSAYCAPAADEVTTLPGWTGALPSRIYSGFISAGSDVQDGTNYTMQMWYMFVEADAPNPKDLPVILWSNGGPGASSAFGLFTELGPFTLSDQSMLFNPPKLFANPYSWSKLANIVILNGPAPVGYSYCEPAGPGGIGTSCGSWNDTRTAIHNIAFVEGFFAAFPEYAQNDVFVAGESYAGVYTAMIVDGLLEKQSPLKIRGLALVDACMGTEVLCGPSQAGPWLDLLFSSGQGCVSLDTFTSILTECPLKTLQEGAAWAVATPACKAAVRRAADDCPSGAFYGYNYLDQCPPDPFRAASSDGASDVPVPIEPSGYPCGGDSALKAWITRPDVKSALHIAQNANFWSFDNGEGFVYNVTWPSNLPLIRRLQTGVDGIRLLAINGETDPSISSFKTQNWTTSLNFPLKEAWRPWTFPNSTVVAGSVRQWEGGFTHVTIRGR
jgi:serine carboxypeptidase-like clade 1